MNKLYKNVKDARELEISDSQWAKFKDSIYKGFRPMGERTEEVVKLEIIKDEPKEVVQVDLQNSIEEIIKESSLTDSIEDLRWLYSEKFGKEVSNKFKNNAEWIKSKLDEEA